MNWQTQLVKDVAAEVINTTPQQLDSTTVQNMIDAAICAREEERNITPKEVAHKLGCDVSSVWRYAEAGELVNRCGRFPFPKPIPLTPRRTVFLCSQIIKLQRDLAVAAGAVAVNQ